MIEAILICALALPLHKTHGEDFLILMTYLERAKPGYAVVLVHEDEDLLGDAEATPMHYDNMRIWMAAKTRRAMRAGA